MTKPVPEAVLELELRGVLRRHRRDDSARIIDHVRTLLGRELPADLEDFYRERVAKVGDFLAVAPVWNDHAGWRTPDSEVTELLAAGAVPVFLDGCGNLFGLDLTSGGATPAVYFFDHEGPRPFDRPIYAAGSSLGAFLLLLAEHDHAVEEGRPTGWELLMDPDIDNCPRAPPLWRAD